MPRFIRHPISHKHICSLSLMQAVRQYVKYFRAVCLERVKLLELYVSLKVKQGFSLNFTYLLFFLTPMVYFHLKFNAEL